MNIEISDRQVRDITDHNISHSFYSPSFTSKFFEI